MSTSIEERVVQMRFDNKQFEAGAKESIKTLDKLSSSLDLDGVAKSSGRGFKSISDATDSLSIKFDALSVVAVTALTRITNAAISTGSRLVNALTVEPVSQGWDEYELKMNSVQTIIASTGESLEKVNEYLDELNVYADRTIYSFADMTNNIGKFTNAGVELKDAVKAIQGISNEAALSGANANEASRAMYNFSQALSSGVVRLIDWKSIENANMATVEFKKELLKTAVAVGTVVEKNGEYISTTTDMQGNISSAFTATKAFNDSLSAQWLTSEVLIETLSRYSDETTDLGQRAYAAAQDVKTASQMFDTLKEAVGSGWAQTWEILFGNFEEAKELWTGISNVIGGAIDSISSARNNALLEWKSTGGRDTLLEGLSKAWQALESVILKVRDAIRKVFPIDWVKVLHNVSNAVLRFGESLQLSDDALTTLGEVVKAVLVPVNILFQVLRVGWAVITNTISVLWNLVDVVLALPTAMGGFQGILEKIFGEERYSRLAAAFGKVVDGLAAAFGALVGVVFNVLSGFKGLETSKLGAAFKRLADILEPIADWILDRIVEGIEAIANADYSKLTDWAATGLTFVVDRLEDIQGIAGSAIGAISEFFTQFDNRNPVDFFNNLIESVLNLKKTAKTTFKGLGVKTISESIKEETSGIADVISNLGEALSALMAKLTPAKILVFGFGVTLTSVLMNVSKAFDSFTKVGTAVTGTFNSVTGVFKAVQERIKPNKFQKIAAAILLMAGAMVAMSLVNPYKLQQATKAMVVLMAGLTVMVGAFAAIEKFLLKGDDFSKMLREMSVLMLGISAAVIILAGAMLLLQNLNVTQVIGPLALVLTSMLGLALTISVLAKYTKGELPKNALTLVAFALAIKIVVNALEDLAQADLSGIIDNIGALIIAVGLLGALSLAAGKVSFKTGLGVTLLIFDILLFSKVLGMLGKIQPEPLIKGILGMMGIMTALVPLFWLSSLAGKEALKMGLAMIAMVAAIGLLQFAIKSIGKIPLVDLAKGTAVVIGLLAMFGLLNSMSKVAKDETVKGLGKSFLAMAAAILLLGVAIEYIGHLDLAVALQGGIVVGALLALFALIVKQASGIEKATGTIVAMVTAIGIMTAAVMLLTLLPFGETLLAASTLSLVMVSFGVAMNLIQGIDWKSALISAGMMLAVTLSITTVLHAINDLNPEGMLEKAAAFGLVVAALGAALGIMNLHSGKWGDVAKTAGIMGLALLEVLGVVWALNAIPLNDGLLVKTVALSGVLLALSMTTDKLKARTGDFMNLLKTIGFMGLFVAEATAVVALLNAIPINEGLLTKTLALAAVMTTMSFTTEKLKARTGDFMNLLKTLGFMGLFVAEATAVVALLNALPVNEGLIEKAAALSLVLVAMSAAVAIISQISGSLVVLSTMGASAVKGALIAEAIIGTMVGVVLLLGGLFALFPDLEGPLTMAEQMLPRIGAVIGSFFGNVVGGFVGGVASGITSQLPKMADDLALFAEKIKPFLEIRVEQGVVDAVVRLAEVVALVTASRFLDGVASFLTGKSSLVKFGEELEKFTPHFRAFADGMDGINVEAVTAAGTAMSGLGDVLATIPTEGGLMSGLFGGQDFSSFSEGLASFAEAMKTYFDIISTTTITQEQVDATKYATDALVTLAEKVPKSGGALQGFFGTSDIGTFGRQLLQFGMSLSSFFTVISAANIDYELVKACASAGKSLAEFANKVPAAGGTLQAWFGAQDIGVFGRQLVSFGMALRDFFLTMTAEGLTIDQNVVNACISAGEAFATFSEKVPRMGNAFEWFTGKKDMAAFGDQIRGFGEGLADFFTSFKGAGVTETDVTLANTAMDGFGKLADTLGENGGISKVWSGSDLEKFGKQIKKLGEYLSDYYIEISTIDLDQVNLSIATAQAFLDLNGALTETGTSVVDTVKKVMSDVIAGANEILGITGNYSEKFRQIGEHVISGFSKGIKDYGPASKEDMKAWGADVTAAFAGAVGVNSPSTKFAEIGMYVVQGFQQGIEKNLVAARNTVIKMGQQIVSAFRGFFKIKSPSKLMRDEVGRYIVEGIAEGITEDMSAEEAASKKAQNILNAFQAEFDKFSLDISTIGLEGDLWAARNPNASEAAVKQQNIDATTKKLQAQAERVNLANAQYQATLKALGEQADETQQAYNTYLQEQITMYQYANELAELQKSNVGTSNKWDTTTLELQLELWEKTSEVVDEAERTEKEIEIVSYQLQAQAEKVLKAEDVYQELLEQLGPDSDATISAYQEFLQAQITMADLAQDLLELRTGEAYEEAEEDARTRRDKFLDFADLMNEQYDQLKSMGFSDEEIKRWGYEQSGWYPEQTVNKLQNEGKETIQSIMDQFLMNADMALQEVGQTTSANVEDIVQGFLDSATWAINEAGGGLEFIFTEPVVKAIDSATAAGVSAGSSGGGSVGSAMGGGIGDGLMSGMEEMIPNAELGLSDVMDILTEEGVDASEVMGDLMGGTWLDSLNEKIRNGGSSAVDAVNWFYQQVTGQTVEGAAENGGISGRAYVDGSVMAIDDNTIVAQMATERMMGAAGKTGTTKAAAEGALAGVAYDKETATGIEDNDTVVNTAAEGLINGAATAADAVIKSKMPGIGTNVAIGLANGMRATSASSAVKGAAAYLATLTATTAANRLGVESPSRVFYEIGKYIDQGLANGILDEYGIVAGSIRSLTDDLANTNPTISPVVDLDNWNSGVKKMGMSMDEFYSTILQWDANGNLVPYGYNNTGNPGRWIKVDAATAQAVRSGNAQIEGIAYRAANFGNIRSNSEDAENVPTYTFIQNNTSPKSLTTAEIYRNTKNLLSRKKTDSEVTFKSKPKIV